jgi:diacylglycerol kinase family enzyme
MDCTPAAPVEADGQLVGTTPALFTVWPKALRVLVP